MVSGRLPFAAAGSITLLVLVLDLVLFSVNCHGDSSCGDIHNISFPFRLKSHPNDNCGDKNFELTCDENNRTILYYYSGKYYVQEIDYDDYTIRVVDVGIERNNCSTRPLHSLASFNRTPTVEDPYSWWDLSLGSLAVLVSCENPVKSPHLYIDIPASCDHHNGGGVPVSSFSSSSDDLFNYSPPMRHSYVLVEDITTRGMMVSDLADSCMVDLMVMGPLCFGNTSEYHEQRKNNISFLDVHNWLADGFSLWWDFMSCKKAERQKLCFDNNPEITFPCYGDYSLNRTIVATVVHQLRFYWEYMYYYLPRLCPIIGPILAARFLCAPCVFAFLIRKFRRRHQSMYDNVEGFLRSQNNLMPINYSYSDIRKMTKGFRDKLGEGGYGSVHKGKLRSGNLVAVKMLSKPKADGQEFINEVATIGRIHHINVVQLIGYCAERSKRALIYDFMPNGSLEKYIFSREGNLSLSCEQMYKISLGVARGIEYLHRGCDMQILHFDIKPHNILLDENFTPKVSDFGLAKLYPTDDSIVSLTAARGTLGYMAPELFYKNIGGVSYKADIYSYGMLLMEIAGRRRNWNASADSSQIYFPSWVYDQFTEGRNVEMGESTEEEKEMVKKMMVVALWCIQMKPSDRPSMNKVVEMLEGNIENIQTPPKPFLYPQQTNPTMFPNNLSGACLDSITVDISAR